MISGRYSNTVSVEVQKMYASLRSSGVSRECTLLTILDRFDSEIVDFEDRFFVMVGIVVSMASKKELTVDIANETIHIINQLRKETQSDAIGDFAFLEVEQLLANKENFGDEASFEFNKRYRADWKIGETFSHIITDPVSKALGIYNWLIIFYKTGEFTDEFGSHRHLMYVSICPPERKPATAQQLQSLGFLKMMRHDLGWDYLAQITINSKREEHRYELTSIGYFPDIALPNDRTEENPLSAMPLFGRIKKNDPCPRYEMQICRLYKKHGMLLNQTDSNSK